VVEHDDGYGTGGRAGRPGRWGVGLWRLKREAAGLCRTGAVGATGAAGAAGAAKRRGSGKEEKTGKAAKIEKIEKKLAALGPVKSKFATDRTAAVVPVAPPKGPVLRIYTDGGCSGNPGPGGWAYVIIRVKTVTRGAASTEQQETLEENWGAERATTNNRMELSAAVFALAALSRLKVMPRQVTIFTDSQYVQRGMSEWIHTWKKNGWRNSERKPVKNQELWQRLDGLTEELPVTWEWVKGHAGNAHNERCDYLTQRAIASLSHVKRHPELFDAHTHTHPH